MKISEVVAELQKLQTVHGDIEVVRLVGLSLAPVELSLQYGIPFIGGEQRFRFANGPGEWSQPLAKIS